MHRLTLLVVSFALLAAPAAALAQAATAKGLAAGKIYVTSHKVKGCDTPEIRVRAVIDAPPKKIWPLVSNCNQFSRTMPRIKKGRIVKRRGKHVFCKVTVDMPFPLSDITSTTDGVHVERPCLYSRHWKLVSGDYTRNEGSWVLTCFNKNPRRTMVAYTVLAEPKTAVPTWLRTKAQKSSLPDMINKLRKIAKNMGY